MPGYIDPEAWYVSLKWQCKVQTQSRTSREDREYCKMQESRCIISKAEQEIDHVFEIRQTENTKISLYLS